MKEVNKVTKKYQFWYEEKPKKGPPIITILPDKLLEFCSDYLGYYNYVDYTGNYILVKKTNGSIVEEVKPQDLKQDIKFYLRNEIKELGVWAVFAHKNIITENFIHLLEKLPEANFNLSKKDEAYFFYKNGVVKVMPNNICVIAYEKFTGTVWKNQIIQRNFIYNDKNVSLSVFNTFLHNICKNDNNRYISLISILGYILHPYKDPSLTKAVILLDENVDFSGEAHGGTGKSLIAKAIEHITPTVWKDGKKYNPNEIFVFDDIRPYHRVLYFDDVKQNFSFEEFYSLITGSLKVNRKYKDSTLIPSHLTPQVIN